MKDFERNCEEPIDKRDSDQNSLGALLLSLRRFIAFIIDFNVFAVSIYLIECLIGLYLVFYTDYNPWQKRGPLENFFLFDIHLVLIPLLFGISISQVFKGKSIGCRVMRISVISPHGKWMSLTGCTIRAFIALGPPFLFYWLVFVPYATRQIKNGLSLPQLEFTVFIWLILVIPVSILWGKGQQGIHDHILNMRVIDKRSEAKKYFHSPLSILGFVITSTVLAIALVQFVQNFELVHKLESQLAPIANRYVTFWKENEAAAFSQRININLEEPPFRNKVIDWGVGLGTSLAPEKLDSGVTIQGYPYMPKIKLLVGGNADRNLETTVLEIGEKLIQSDINYEYFIIDCARKMRLDIFYFTLQKYCFYRRGISKPIGCKNSLELAPVIWNWSSQLPPLR